MKAYFKRVSGRTLELGFIHLLPSHTILGPHLILELLDCCSQIQEGNTEAGASFNGHPRTGL